MAKTSLIGLLLPTTGSLSGQWGGAVNNAISEIVDVAVAGTQTLSTDADVTLTVTEGAYNATGLTGTSAQYAIILCTGARTDTHNITAPAQSKTYVVINDTTGGYGVVIRGAGPTTGVTIAAGERALVAWTGSDFEIIASPPTGDVAGPASSTDNAITRFDLATGKLVQNSLVTVDDDGAVVAPSVGSIIPFYFADQAAFPSAATYHGALAHSHADGAMFFAHGGVWNRLAGLTSNTFTGAQIGTVSALTSTSNSIAVDLAVNNNFSHTTTENTTLASPSNPVAGQSGVITITQGATPRTLAYNSFWKFAGGVVPTLTATGGAVDVLTYYVESGSRATAQLVKDVK